MAAAAIGVPLARDVDPLVHPAPARAEAGGDRAVHRPHEPGRRGRPHRDAAARAPGAAPGPADLGAQGGGALLEALGLGLDVLAVAAHARQQRLAARADLRGARLLALQIGLGGPRAVGGDLARASESATSACTSAIASRVPHLGGVGLDRLREVAVARDDHLQHVGRRDRLGEAARLQQHEDRVGLAAGVEVAEALPSTPSRSASSASASASRPARPPAAA